jgi:O-acetylhomoserine (thiol)-lyase
VPLRNTGSAMSPFNAFLILQGIETLPLRMERHCDNAIAVANYLNDHASVSWVKFAGLPDSPYYELAQKYTNGRPSALLTFGIEGGFDAAVKFYDSLQLFKRLVNIGDAKSLAAHPASTTHRQLAAEELVAAGVSDDMIRLCVGIEHIDDIIADIEQGCNELSVISNRLNPKASPENGRGFFVELMQIFHPLIFASDQGWPLWANRFDSWWLVCGLL